MAKAELGTKRTDPDNGKKFYDLNRDPVVSPYSGKSWPLSFFEESKVAAIMEKVAAEEDEVAEVDAENTEVELVSLEDADEAAANGDDVPDDIGDDEVELDDDDDDTFLEADEDDDDDDMTGIIGVNGDDDDV